MPIIFFDNYHWHVQVKEYLLELSISLLWYLKFYNINKIDFTL